MKRILSIVALVAAAASLGFAEGGQGQTSIEIEGDSHIQIDGDYAGKTPAKIDVVKDALKLIVPNRQ